MYMWFDQLNVRPPTSLVLPQYGHSQSEKKLGFGDKYHRSIKVHT